MNDTPDDQGSEETQSYNVIAPGTKISRYEVIEKIGAGGMGVVYKALDTKLDRTLALKFLSPHLLRDAEARERFEQEAKAASALNHPNIATIYEIDEVGDQCFIAMEYVEGRMLRDLIKERELTLDEVLDLAIQIGEGLAAAHDRDVIHRDIKPANIMLTSEGRIKIMDFGLAKLRGASKLTEEGTTMGTLPYMSPDQVQGKGIDRRSDIFSLGTVLYEMITGRLPFRGDNEAATIRAIVNDDPEPLARYKAGVMDELQRIVSKALAKEPDERYQHADDLVADLKHEKRISERVEAVSGEREAKRASPRARVFRLAAPLAALAVLVVLYFVFEPFRVELGPGNEALAQENSLAIMYFENVAEPGDPERTARMITSLLIADLSESRYLSVMSRQRLFDILHILGKEDVRTIDKTVASEVANKAGVKWVLTGDILQVEPSIVLTADISDVKTGEIIATQRISGNPEEDIFAVVDRLSKAIKEDLSLSEAAAAETDLSISDATTSSPEAYRHFMEGWDYVFKHYSPEAIESFRMSLQHDDTFAMAYWSLARLVSEPEKSHLMAKAVEHSHKASRNEQLYLAAMAARHAGDYKLAVEKLTELIELHPDHTAAHISLGITYKTYLGEPRKAITYYRMALAIDPYYKETYNQLAYTYDLVGDLDNAIWAINQYIELAPDEANPYDTRGDLYAFNGKLDEALASYRRASEIKPDFSTLNEGAMHLFKREYARADSCFSVLVSHRDKSKRSAGRLALAVVPIFQGKFDEALEILDAGIATDRMEQTGGSFSAGKPRLKAVIYLEKGQSESAVDAALKNMEFRFRDNPNDVGYSIGFCLEVMILAGNIAAAESLAVAKNWKLGGSMGLVTPSDLIIRALFDQEKNDYENAISSISEALEMDDTFTFLFQEFLGETYMRAGRLGEAVEFFEAALSRYDLVRAIIPIRAVKTHYRLGQAYEESGWKSKAIDEYETFLEIWQNADPGIPAVDDARRRLTRLKASS